MGGLQVCIIVCKHTIPVKIGLNNHTHNTILYIVICTKGHGPSWCLKYKGRYFISNQVQNFVLTSNDRGIQCVLPPPPPIGPMTTKMYRQVTKLSSQLSSGVSSVLSAGWWEPVQTGIAAHCLSTISPSVRRWIATSRRSLRTFVNQPRNVSSPATHTHRVSCEPMLLHVNSRSKGAERAQLCSYLPS